jgi:phosphate/sulfate permease
MEKIYVIIVSLLLILAVSDLIVGVSNDAVNFLNSAVGSKVAPLRVILIVATIGILLGATFSSGMMEVARRGIFNPGEFYFSELIMLFLAVMATDILLLDLFNTFGLPTSTTVSIVFELLGAAVGMTIIKITRDPEVSHNMITYINSAKSLAIISGILLSVVISFTFGTLIMFITRTIFSFNINRTLKYYGSLWGGIAISIITYFILIKGASGASFMSDEVVAWIKTNSLWIILFSVVGWTIILQILSLIFKINILKVIVLIGTFSLAMAFAGNDLVNFIGVPLAGFESFREWIASGLEPDKLKMTALAAQVKTPTFFLLIAGIIMVFALWTSKKARTVSRTEIGLAKHDSESELFESTPLARAMVRMSVVLSNKINHITPPSVNKWLDRRFDTSVSEKLNAKEGVSFDMLRASVNLVVASALIAFGTSLKLPLSTTYVTFMVAMGSSLADRAWGRETAVYRITGVLVVVGGWFFTAFAAFTVSLLIALFINWGKIIAIAIMTVIIVIVIIHSYKLHGRRLSESNDKEKAISFGDMATNETILPFCRETLVTTINSMSSIYDKLVIALKKDSRKSMKNVYKEVRSLNKVVKLRKDNVYKFIRKLDDNKADAGPYYVQIFDYLREAAHSLNFIAEPAFIHIDNNHAPLANEQQEELKEFNLQLGNYLKDVVNILNSGNFKKIKVALQKQQDLLQKNEQYRKLQLKRIKKGQAGTRASILYLNILSESKNMVLQLGNVLKAFRDFSEALIG